MVGISAELDFEIHQMDVKCAFLNGVPEEEIFIKVPDGLGVELPPGHGLKLQKSLYGLKQSPRCWYKALSDFFESIGFLPAIIDPCLFYHQDPSRPCFVFVHVDDLVIMGPNVNFLKDKIKSRFEMEDMGECKYVLGMRVKRDRVNRTITLSQDRYAREILEEFGLLNCKPTLTPLPGNTLTCPIKNQPVDPGFNYRRGVGLLQYLVQCTRPDLALSVSYLSQFLNSPDKIHQEQHLYTLRYVQHSKDFGLTLGRVGKAAHRLVGYADASYATGVDSATFAGSVVEHNGIVGWRCQKQDDDAPSLSTTEAEYRSCASTSQDLRWAQQLLEQIYPLLNIKTSPTNLFCNNQGALALLKDSVCQHRTRHVNFRHHWLRFHIYKAKNFDVHYIATKDKAADFLTKPLNPKKTRMAVSQVNLKNIEFRSAPTA